MTDRCPTCNSRVGPITAAALRATAAPSESAISELGLPTYNVLHARVQELEAEVERLQSVLGNAASTLSDWMDARIDSNVACTALVAVVMKSAKLNPKRMEPD